MARSEQNVSKSRLIEQTLERDYPRLVEMAREMEPCSLKTEAEAALRELWDARHFIQSSYRQPGQKSITNAANPGYTSGQG